MRSIRNPYVAWAVTGGTLACILAYALHARVAVADGAPAIDKDGLVYTGQLTKGGQPLAGTVSIQGSLYTTADVNNNVPVCIKKLSANLTDGRFAVPFDNPKCLDAVHTNKDLWVVVSVSGEDLPAVKVSAVPFAHEAERANGLSVGAAQALVPPGTVIAYAGVTLPAGWVACDGAEYGQADAKYAALYAAIGTAHGSGTAPGKFNVPDYRGRFLRGVDSGAGRDPDSGTRAAMNAGGVTGDKVGTLQGAATAVNGLSNNNSTVSGTIGPDGVHTHAVMIKGPTTDAINVDTGAGLNGWAIAAGIGGANNGQWKLIAAGTSDSAHSHKFDLTAPAQKIQGDKETRPINANVNYLIKL